MTSRYLPHGVFYRDLQARVEAHAAAVPADLWRLWLKTAVILVWFAGSYAALVFAAQTWWQAGLAAVSLGLAMAGIGFNVQHDGGHRAASRHEAVNRAMAMGLDLLGGSSYVWHWKHNVHHHTNPNSVGLDADIDIQPLVRLAPDQVWKPWHRYQHLFIWFLYALLAVKWQFIDDFQNVITGRIAGQKFPRPRGWNLVTFVVGKALFFTWAIAVPLWLHPWNQVLLGYLVASVTVSLCLALTFQVAHCVEQAHFPSPDAGRVEWAEHQLRTSVDFAPGHRLWTWFLGGLNYQTAHHLFPRLSHVQLAAVAPLLREACAAHGLSYRVLPSFGAALASHLRWLKRMGSGPGVTVQGEAEALHRGSTRLR